MDMKYKKIALLSVPLLVAGSIGVAAALHSPSAPAQAAKAKDASAKVVAPPTSPQTDPDQNKAQIMQAVADYVNSNPTKVHVNPDFATPVEAEQACVDRGIVDSVGYSDYTTAYNSAPVQILLKGVAYYDAPGTCRRYAQ
jgi:hypothetical protein